MKTVAQIAAELGLKRDAISKRIAKLGIEGRMISRTRVFTPAQVRKIVNFEPGKPGPKGEQ